MKVLVVDDSVTMRSIIKRALTAPMGIPEEEISEAADGQEAPGVIAASSFDLYMVDWNMPNT
ncbi:MAG: response regulator [Planctomycetes bacterium]|nr:response regulator [Planctomycetota bacterium]